MSFRTKLMIAMMLVVFAVTALALFIAQRNLAATVKHDWQQEFQGELATLHAFREIRHAALAELCRTLARKPRIHAALEDNALDLLYPSARDELRDIIVNEAGPNRESGAQAIHARFYRFLDGRGQVIAPPAGQDAGRLDPAEEAQVTLETLSGLPQTGYLARKIPGLGDEVIDEVIAMPIVSTDTGAAIAALVLGFKPLDLSGKRSDVRIKSGIWLNGRLHLPALADATRILLAAQLSQERLDGAHPEDNLTVQIDGAPYLLFYNLLNPESPFPHAHEVCLYPLAESIARQHRLFWQLSSVGALLLLGAFGASRYLSIRLALPVEKLAIASEENRTQRVRAETALELTHEELQRSARFSADASHQLKTPVTVLRAGLEELLSGEKLASDVREEVSTLVHQTFRLTSIIEDLLLLSRMDAGRLQLDFSPVNLTHLIESWLDDLGALPDELNLKIETDYPPALFIRGEKNYTMIILQNLMENARKYNHPGGKIRLAARVDDPWCILVIGNTGRPISAAAQEHIFQRFHRGAVGEDIPGHGLGLNLARELARLHGGDLRLARSDEAWTEFEVRFRLAQPAAEAAPASA
jgi:signal transduction histidine kinase